MPRLGKIFENHTFNNRLRLEYNELSQYSNKEANNPFKCVQIIVTDTSPQGAYE